MGYFKAIIEMQGEEITLYLQGNDKNEAIDYISIYVDCKLLRIEQISCIEYANAILKREG